MATTQEEQKTLDLGFVGVGWIGRNRMEALLQDEKINAAAIFEPSEENASEAKKVAKNALFRSSVSEIFQDENLDGIVIATPSAIHAQQSIEALKAGKSVFCQKPLGRTAAEVTEVVKASEKSNKLLAVDLSYRYTEAFKAIYQLIQNKEIGEIYAVDLVFHNAYGPDKEWFYDLERSGGGCVMDLGIHLIDLALWCLDFPEVTELNSNLYSQGRKLQPGEMQVEDFASVSMLSGKDTLINLDCSWHISAGKDAVIEANFYGTNGGASFKNLNGSFYDFQAEKFHGTQSELLVSPPDNWGGRAGVAWAEKLMDGKGFDPVSSSEFIKTAEIIDRIYKR